MNKSIRNDYLKNILTILAPPTEPKLVNIQCNNDIKNINFRSEIQSKNILVISRYLVGDIINDNPSCCNHAWIMQKKRWHDSLIKGFPFIPYSDIAVDVISLFLNQYVYSAIQPLIEQCIKEKRINEGLQVVIALIKTSPETYQWYIDYVVEAHNTHILL